MGEYDTIISNFHDGWVVGTDLSVEVQAECNFVRHLSCGQPVRTDFTRDFRGDASEGITANVL